MIESYLISTNISFTKINFQQPYVASTSTETTPPISPGSTPNTTCQKTPYSSSDLIKSNTAYCLPCNLPKQYFTDAQIDRLAYMMPYHMKNHQSMKPPDCRGPKIMNDAQTQLQKAFGYCTIFKEILMCHNYTMKIQNPDRTVQNFSLKM